MNRDLVAEYLKLRGLRNRFTKISGDCNSERLPEAQPRDYKKEAIAAIVDNKDAILVGAAALGTYGLSKTMQSREEVELQAEIDKLENELKECNGINFDQQQKELDETFSQMLQALSDAALDDDMAEADNEMQEQLELAAAKIIELQSGLAAKDKDIVAKENEIAALTETQKAKEGDLLATIEQLKLAAAKAAEDLQSGLAAKDQDIVAKDGQIAALKEADKAKEGDLLAEVRELQLAAKTEKSQMSSKLDQNATTLLVMKTQIETITKAIKDLLQKYCRKNTDAATVNENQVNLITDVTDSGELEQLITELQGCLDNSISDLAAAKDFANKFGILAEENDRIAKENDVLATKLQQKATLKNELATKQSQLKQDLAAAKKETQKRIGLLATEKDIIAKANEVLAQTLEQKAKENEELANEQTQLQKDLAAAKQAIKDRVGIIAQENQAIADENAVLAETEAQIAILKDELATKQNALRDLAAAKKDLEQRIGLLAIDTDIVADEKDRLATTLDQKAKENEELANKQTQLEQDLAAAKQAIEDRVGIIAQEDQAIADKKAVLAETETQIAILKDELAKKQNALQVLAAAKLELEKKIALVAEEKDRIATADDELAQTLEQIAKENEELAKKQNQLEKDLAAAKQEIERKIALVAEQKDRIATANDVLAQTVEQKAKENEELAKKQKQLEIDLAAAKELEIQIIGLVAEKDARIATATDVLAKTAEQIANLKDNLAKKQSQLKQDLAAAKELEGRIGLLANEFDQIAKDNEQVARTVEQKAKENEKLAKRHSQLIKDLAAAKDLKGRIGLLATAGDIIAKEKDALAKKLDQKANENDELARKQTQLEKDLAAAKGDNTLNQKQLINQLDDWREKILQIYRGTKNICDLESDEVKLKQEIDDSKNLPELVIELFQKVYVCMLNKVITAIECTNPSKFFILEDGTNRQPTFDEAIYFLKRCAKEAECKRIEIQIAQQIGNNANLAVLAEAKTHEQCDSMIKLHIDTLLKNSDWSDELMDVFHAMRACNVGVAIADDEKLEEGQNEYTTEKNKISATNQKEKLKEYTAALLACLRKKNQVECDRLLEISAKLLNIHECSELTDIAYDNTHITIEQRPELLIRRINGQIDCTIEVITTAKNLIFANIDCKKASETEQYKINTKVYTKDIYMIDGKKCTTLADLIPLLKTCTRKAEYNRIESAIRQQKESYVLTVNQTGTIASVDPIHSQIADLLLKGDWSTELMAIYTKYRLQDRMPDIDAFKNSLLSRKHKDVINDINTHLIRGDPQLAEKLTALITKIDTKKDLHYREEVAYLYKGYPLFINEEERNKITLDREASSKFLLTDLHCEKFLYYVKVIDELLSHIATTMRTQYPNQYVNTDLSLQDELSSMLRRIDNTTSEQSSQREGRIRELENLNFETESSLRQLNDVNDRYHNSYLQVLDLTKKLENCTKYLTKIDKLYPDNIQTFQQLSSEEMILMKIQKGIADLSSSRLALESCRERSAANLEEYEKNSAAYKTFFKEIDKLYPDLKIPEKIQKQTSSEKLLYKIRIAIDECKKKNSRKRLSDGTENSDANRPRVEPEFSMTKTGNP